jgi:hypothetical protein
VLYFIVMLMLTFAYTNRFKVGKTSPQMVGGIFRCLVPAVGNEESRVMMPLLASGGQVCLYFN